MIKSALFLILLIGCSNNENKKDPNNENNKNSLTNVSKKNKYSTNQDEEINSKDFDELINEYYELYKDEKLISNTENENILIIKLKEKLIRGEEFYSNNQFIWNTILNFNDEELIELIINSFKNNNDLEKAYSQMLNTIIIINNNSSFQPSIFIKVLQIFIEKATSLNFMLNKYIEAYTDLGNFRGNILDLALYIKDISLIIKLLEKRIILSPHNIDKISNINDQELIEILIKNYTVEEFLKGKIINKKELVKKVLEKKIQLGYEQIIEIFKTDDQELTEIFIKNYSMDEIFEGDLNNKKELIKELLKRQIKINYEQALRIIKIDDKELIEILIKNYPQEKLLLEALKNNHKEILRKILSRVNHIKVPFLIEIILTDDVELVEILLSIRFDINTIFEVVENSKKQMYTLVEYSTIKKSNKIALYLLNRNAKIYVEGTSSNLPFLAVYYRNIEVIEYLISQKKVKFDKIFDKANRSFLDLIKDEKAKLENELQNIQNTNPKKLSEAEQKKREYGFIINLIEENQN